MYNVHPQEMFADWENTQRRTLPQLNAFCNAVLASSQCHGKYCGGEQRNNTKKNIYLKYKLSYFLLIYCIIQHRLSLYRLRLWKAELSMLPELRVISNLGPELQWKVRKFCVLEYCTRVSCFSEVRGLIDVL